MKGQYFSFDAIIASVIFILALVTLLSAWQSLRTSLEHQSNALTFEALRIGEQLLIPGSPASADCTGMNSIGLAFSWHDRRLNNATLSDCVSSSLTDSELSGRLGTPYGVSIYLNDVHKLGPDIRATSPPGLKEIAHVQKVVSLYDPVSLKADDANLDIYVYR